MIMLSRCIFLFSVICTLITGCSQPLRTLMAVGAEQDAQAAYVKRQKRSFDLLVSDIRRGRLKTGSSSQEIIARYGEPVLKKDATFVYRSAVEFFDTPKVYLQFDEKDTLIDIRLQEKD